jgi:hypothetical protein
MVPTSRVTSRMGLGMGTESGSAVWDQMLTVMRENIVMIKSRNYLFLKCLGREVYKLRLLLSFNIKFIAL